VAGVRSRELANVDPGSYAWGVQETQHYRNYTARARRVAWALDRTVAPALALARPPRVPGPARAGERLLLVRADHVGDVLMATPAIAALRRARPEARIDLLASPWGAPAAQGNPDLHQVLTLPATWYEAARAGTLRLADLRASRAAVRAAGYDSAVDLRGDPRIVLFLAACGIRSLVGFSHLGMERILGAATPFDPGLDHRRRNLAVLAPLGADQGSAPQVPVFTVTDAARVDGEDRLADAARPRLVVAPGTNRPRHTWPPARFADAASRALDRLGGSIVLVGREADRPATAAVREALRVPAIDLTGATDLVGLAGVLAASDVLLANDSGAVHLAAAVGCPTVALYGPTSPALSFPYGPAAGRALVGTGTCSRPCFDRGCRASHGYEELEPDAVAGEICALLRERGAA